MPEHDTRRIYRLETVAVHGGYEDVEPTTRSRVVPIYQTTSYTFKDDQHAANLFALKEPGNIYTRLMNPTNDVLEKRIARLEGGIGALVVSSGQSAESLTILQLLRAGDEFSASQELYGGTRTLFEHTLARLGIKANFFNPNDPEQLEKSINPRTKAVFIESLPNPSLLVPDIEKIATIAHEHQIPLIVDNTVPSPVLLNPIKFGADIVVHSTTKYISGHGYSLGGVIVDSGNFPWNTAPHFKDFDAPDPTYHGLNFWQSFGNAAFIVKARVQLLRDVGTAASPFNSWLALIGLETLPLRMERICANAQKVAGFLKEHPKVAWVNYPGLRKGKDAILLKKYLPRGYSGILGLGLKGGYDAGKNLINHVKIFSHLANIGDAKSLIIHPASTTHQQLEPKDQVAAGVTPDFIRLSIGIENVDDLIEDLDTALSKI
ncbi:MAG: O-acetylhomoserine aminocarboxypropyltransferase/cysteine synthase [Candidatus Lokiarchaeota archaeon]|nr:O-acetylhomoserine aminocarboxypropyltransferase/cysteine synthase [Candidatus Lokiarchaeota archaeon]